MEQGLENVLARQALQVAARFAQADAAHANVADLKLTAHQTVERNAAGDQVAAAFRGAKFQGKFPGCGFDRFCFDQR